MDKNSDRTSIRVHFIWVSMSFFGILVIFTAAKQLLALFIPPTAESYVQIIRNGSPISPGDTYPLIMKSYVIAQLAAGDALLQKSLSDGTLKSFPNLNSTEDLISAIMAGIRVDIEAVPNSTRGDKTSLRVRFTCCEPEEA